VAGFGVINSSQHQTLDANQVREHFGDCREELRRDDLTDFRAGKEALRERLVLDERHPVLECAFLDALREVIAALGQNTRRRHRFALVFERDGVVRRVGDDDSGLGHIVEHATARELALQAAHASLDLGAALVLARFVADFLSRHLQARQPAVALQPVICER
jgi:hypothetical protein